MTRVLFLSPSLVPVPFCLLAFLLPFVHNQVVDKKGQVPNYSTQFGSFEITFSGSSLHFLVCFVAFPDVNLSPPSPLLPPSVRLNTLLHQLF